ncbi:hypothetical protein [Actinomadura rudentiformis]|uniref:Uncharacterized protein n=1 Tax=Actinomadura rudentiformis TaxID=359158 RepID=A0A6H9YLA9_9ACTN|nr:hypothetical protein [Actinomadura rudentiformis]KAB2347289.1 hypothetical protein F8566_19955 [Actinomadura rudentiformis]
MTAATHAGVHTIHAQIRELLHPIAPPAPRVPRRVLTELQNVITFQALKCHNPTAHMGTLLLEEFGMRAVQFMEMPPTWEERAEQWEALAWEYLRGPEDDSPTWTRVDELAPGLCEEDRTNWFEVLYTALPIREGDYELMDLPLDDRDPDAIERQARADVDEAIEHLIGGARR